jgi:hypothetical protein
MPLLLLEDNYSAIQEIPRIYEAYFSDCANKLATLGQLNPAYTKKGFLSCDSRDEVIHGAAKYRHDMRYVQDCCFTWCRYIVLISNGIGCSDLFPEARVM